MLAVDDGDKAGRPKIVWGQAALQQKSKTEEEEAREKHRQRAARFNTEFVEPKSDVKVSSLQEITRVGPRGRAPVRLYKQNRREQPTPEELEKRRSRAERFNLIQYAQQLDPSETAKLKRAAKFGIDYKPAEAALADADLFEERKDVPADVPRRENAVHLYGVDVMSTEDVLDYFKEYSPLDVEWLNDSSCNIVFDDPITAKKAIVQMGTPLPEGTKAPDSNGQDGLDSSDIRNLPFFWHKGPDFSKDGTSIPLLFRMATNVDVKDPDAPRHSRELWKKPQARRQAGSARSGGKRTQADALDGPLDEEGDVVMKKRRASRGGVKNKKRVKGMQIDGTGEDGAEDMDYEEVEMDDAEAWEDDVGDDQLVDTEKLLEDVEVEPVGVSDLRELLPRKQSGGLFSAAAAGVRLPEGNPDDADAPYDDANGVEKIEEDGAEEEVEEGEDAVIEDKLAAADRLDEPLEDAADVEDGAEAPPDSEER